MLKSFEMGNQFSQIRKEADEIRIAPPRGAWNRIESKLNSHTAGKRMRLAKFMSYAAAIALVCTVGFLAYYLANVQSYKSTGLYSLSMESLTTTPALGTSIYDIEKVQKLANTLNLED